MSRRKRPAKTDRPQPAAARRSFYSGQFTEAEAALIAGFVEEPSLDDEIWIQRVMNRRLLAFSNDDEIPLEILVRLAEALAAGTGRVARLLRDRRALSGESADGIANAMAKALDELATELGIEL